MANSQKNNTAGYPNQKQISPIDENGNYYGTYVRPEDTKPPKEKTYLQNIALDLREILQENWKYSGIDTELYERISNTINGISFDEKLMRNKEINAIVRYHKRTLIEYTYGEVEKMAELVSHAAKL